MGLNPNLLQKGKLSYYKSILYKNSTIFSI